MEMHKLLLKQLNRLGLSSDAYPNNLEKWQQFLNRVNTTYLESDQERYLNERAIDISSKELLDLNEKLESVQRIAHLGYYLYDKATEKITPSKEFLHLLGRNSSQFLSKFDEFIQIVHKKDKNTLIDMTQKSLSEEAGYEKEIRIQHLDGKYHWYHILVYPLHEIGKSNQVLSIAMDITQRKLTEKEITLLHQKLLTTARQAGMADIAASILHNVGNVLNSANVSLGLLEETIKQPYSNKLILAIELLRTHQDNLYTYLKEDPQGKLIPEYLIAISDLLKNDNSILKSEVNNLNIFLQHIKEIIAMQQQFSHTSGVTEKIFLPEIIDAALKMSGYSLFSKYIQINKIYKKTPSILTDKAKLLQILVNIIQNAKDALLADKRETQKEMGFYLSTLNNTVIIEISDNGVGIQPEDLIKIFSFGFTKKLSGHGIGLHTCAIAAKEIGGSLIAESKGLGFGATFILTLPLGPL